MKKVMGLLLLIVGIGVFIFGSHVAQVAADGQAKVTQAQESEQENTRPIVGPIRRNVKAHVVESTQQKIGQAEQKIVKSQVTANWLRGTGAVLFIMGLGFLIKNFSNKKRN